MTDDRTLTVRPNLQIPLDEIQLSYARSSGPGGQNVNKVNTKVTMHWDVTRSPSLPDGIRERFLQRYRRRLNKEGQLVLHSQRYRDRLKNVDDALSKLRDLILEVADPPTRRKKTRTPRRAKEKRLREKRSVAQKKESRRPPSRGDA